MNDNEYLKNIYHELKYINQTLSRFFGYLVFCTIILGMLKVVTVFDND